MAELKRTAQMLIDEPRAREQVQGIVNAVTSDPALRDDLAQEGLIHLWLVEERRPGQTWSWYLQSCKFHMKNCMALGRSVDSHKRRNGRIKVGADDWEVEELFSRPELETSVVMQVSTRDIISLLSKHLDSRDRVILTMLADGYGAREIARRLGISHAAVVKRRKKIALLASRVGILPPPSNGHDNHNGKSKSHTSSRSVRNIGAQLKEPARTRQRRKFVAKLKRSRKR